MARYDGLIIPRSYSEYINKTDGATLSQALQNSGVMDNAPTENSVKPVKSGGIYNALSGKQPTLTFDDVPTEDSDNPAKSGGIYTVLSGKQDALTFDNTPTENSNNPVKSGGVFDMLNAFIPVGVYLPYGGTTSPNSYWLICDGSAVSRTENAALFAVIGTAYGTGDGSTTFNLPDMRESVPKGAGQTGKTVGAHVKAGGLAVGEFIDDREQTHNHGVGTYQTYWSLAVPSGKTGDIFLSETGDMTASSAVSLTNETRYGASNTSSKYAGLPRGIAVTCKAGNSGSFTGESGNNTGRTGATTEVKAVGCNYIIKVK